MVFKEEMSDTEAKALIASQFRDFADRQEKGEEDLYLLLAERFQDFERRFRNDQLVDNDIFIAKNFWDEWVYASEHGWDEVAGIVRDDWPKLAREIATGFENGTAITHPLLKYFDFKTGKIKATNMNRTQRYRIFYWFSIILLGSLVLWGTTHFNLSPRSIILIIVLLLIPGRIQAYLWRDFYRSRRLMNAKAWQKGIPHLERFLAEIKRRPWLKNLIWLAWGTGTRDIEAMAYNNLGTSKLHLKAFDEAERDLLKARNLDPEYPVPYHNLALLALIKGQTEEARQLWNTAQKLGYRAPTTFDNAARAMTTGHFDSV